MLPPGGAPAQSERPFDLAKLPPIESITAESDIRAFLGRGIPAELTRAALRRAWSADPAIRDFVELSENSWDFNAPGSMGGFGPLEMTEELRRQIAQMVGRGVADHDGDRPAPAPAAGIEEQAPAGPAESREVAGAAEAPKLAMSGDPPGAAQGRPVHVEREAGTCSPVPPQAEIHIAAQNDPQKPERVQVSVRRSKGRALPK